MNASITEDDRLVALTEQLDTRNENTIYFNCVEGSPGGDGTHCAKNANELNMLIKPDPYKVIDFDRKRNKYVVVNELNEDEKLVVSRTKIKPENELLLVPKANL